MIKKAKDAVVKVDAAAGVIFNAVNNWPMEFIANTEQDAVYIEVWPPHVTYHHLYSLIREAKFLGGKHVVLAAYMEPFKETKNMEDIIAAETALLLTNAVIQASGGTQLIFGETNGALCDSYYVNHATIREEFLPSIRLYCDFTVRYGKLLYDPKAMDISMTAANGINDDIKLTAVHNNSIKFSSYGEAGKIWSIIRESDRYLTIQLINLTNVNEFWNQPKYQRPEEIDGIQIDILMDTEIKGIYMATPDENSGIPCKLEYTLLQKDNGQHIVCNIAKLDIWNLVWIELI
jgi:dextranase